LEMKITKILSAAVEDYLRAIHDLAGKSSRRVGTSALAERLGVSSASVTGMLKKLAEVEPRLVDYERYRGVELTPAGKKIALEVVRHHRLIEAYLIEALGYSWDEVHAEADQLEHVISESLEARIAEFLGHPTIDPHGDPIPDVDGSLDRAEEMPLSDLPAGRRGQITRVVDQPDLLRYLDTLKMTLGSQVEVTERAPFDGPLHVVVDDRMPAHALSQVVTDQVYVAPVEK